MDEPQHELEPFTPAERLAKLIAMGTELDLVLGDNGYIRANEAADKLTSEPRNTSLIGVMATGRNYLSPLTGELEHYWLAFIKEARNLVREHERDDEKIIRELYDFIGLVMIEPDSD